MLRAAAIAGLTRVELDPGQAQQRARTGFQRDHRVCAQRMARIVRAKVGGVLNGQNAPVRNPPGKLCLRRPGHLANRHRRAVQEPVKTDLARTAPAQTPHAAQSPPA